MLIGNCKIFFTISIRVSKNAKFYADSEFDEKVAKNHAKKSQQKSVMKKYRGAKF